MLEWLGEARVVIESADKVASAVVRADLERIVGVGSV